MAGTRAFHRRARARHQTTRPVSQPRAGRQRPHLARPGVAPAGKTHLPRARRGPAEGAGLEAIRLRDADFQPSELSFHLRDPAPAAMSAAESAEVRRAVATSGVQHRRQLHHEHELAELPRREHDVDLSQMVALAIHNFFSAAVGIAIAAALVRGIARHTATTIGNFWVDLTRITYYLLLPVCLVLALFFVSQGMIQNFKPYTTAKLIEPQTVSVQKTDANGKPVVDARAVGEGKQDARHANHRAGADGVADCHQDTRHERRRLYECQRRSSV